MLTIVIDTNILIDAWKDDFSYARKILDEVIAGRLRAVVSHKIWREYQLILDRLVNDERHYEFAQRFIAAVEEIKAARRVNVVKYDREDNKFFEAAIAGKAKCIVSNDSDLWEIGEYQGVRVMKDEDFWNWYQGEKSDGKDDWQDWIKGVMGR